MAILAMPASAETIGNALVQAYQNNPQLNAQRANLRATDEFVPQALSGYRPRVGVTASAGAQSTEQYSQAGRARSAGFNAPRTIGATVSQTVFNGFQTSNRVRQAEGQVSSGREALRVLEQAVLLQAATTYMDFLRDSAIVEVQRSNVRVLNETLRQVQNRFNVGEVTRTDVAQSQAQLAAGQTQLAAAESNLVTTRARYRQVIGSEPGSLSPGAPVDRHFPKSLAAAVQQALIENPSVTAAMYGVDVAHLQVKINEGALFPTLALVGSAQYAQDSNLLIYKQTVYSATANLTVPIYQGGSEYSLIRQSKESLAQQRLALEQARDQARATTVQSWGQLETARAQMQSAQAQVSASETALNGVREEARVGQRTTLDVLNAQQALVNARVALVTAQHDRVVASYAVLAAVGALSPQVLGLRTDVYDPRVHYEQIRDSWIGVRTPDGK